MPSSAFRKAKGRVQWKIIVYTQIVQCYGTWPLGFIFCFLFLCKNRSSCSSQLGVHLLQVDKTPSPTWESGYPTQFRRFSSVPWVGHPDSQVGLGVLSTWSKWTPNWKPQLMRFLHTHKKNSNKKQRPYTITLNYLCVKYYFALHPPFKQLSN